MTRRFQLGFLKLRQRFAYQIFWDTSLAHFMGDALQAETVAFGMQQLGGGARIG